ncbi:MAG: DUF2207 domain-containing protein [Ruminococcus sp.]|nr:DUF2207 domain-containing protein [Ruminococcus sp.]
MEKKKSIKTQKYQNKIFIDLLIIVICFIYFSFISHLIGLSLSVFPTIIKGFFNVLGLLFKNLDSLQSLINLILVPLVMIIIVLLLIILFTFPINVICLALRNAYFHRIKEDITYNNNLDITYYRDAFINITPSEMSVIIDYQTEHKKDLTASILSLYLKKYITFENDNLIVLNNNGDTLKKSEKYVLKKLIETKNHHTVSNHELHKLGLEEAIEDGYIENKKSKKNLIKKIIILLIAFLMCMMISKIDIYNNSSDKLDEVMTKITAKYGKDVTDAELLNDPLAPEYIASLSEMTIFAIVILGKIIIPICALIYLIMYATSSSKYKRTKKGNILLEKIAGMKHFIHDFSALSLKEKEEIVLWEDFLIYAIVLEENDKIINDIMKFKKIDIKL